jgi:hypothetical protein
MMLARRAPHPVHGPQYEERAFECAACGVMLSQTFPPAKPALGDTPRTA